MLEQNISKLTTWKAPLTNSLEWINSTMPWTFESHFLPFDPVASCIKSVKMKVDIWRTFNKPWGRIQTKEQKVVFLQCSKRTSYLLIVAQLIIENNSIGLFRLWPWQRDAFHRRTDLMHYGNNGRSCKREREKPSEKNHSKQPSSLLCVLS